jgi:hypothetical protein
LLSRPQVLRQKSHDQIRVTLRSSWWPFGQRLPAQSNLGEGRSSFASLGPAGSTAVLWERSSRRGS